MFWKGHKNLANLPLFFWHYLEVSNYKWEMGHLLWPSQNIRTLWLLHWFNKRLEGFLDFLEKYEMELTIYFFFFLLLYYLVLIDHTVQKLQNLRMYGVILKKTIQLKMMHEQKYKACLSQSISATKKTKKW